jgi:hypothetical protein
MPQPFYPPAQPVARPGQKLLPQKASEKIIPPYTSFEPKAKNNWNSTF